MTCFSLAWIEQVLVWFVEIFAVLALLRLLVAGLAGVPFWPIVAWPPFGAPAAPGQPAAAMGFAGFIVAALNIAIWAFLMIVLIYFVFGLIGCFGGLSFPRLR